MIAHAADARRVGLGCGAPSPSTSPASAPPPSRRSSASWTRWTSCARSPACRLATASARRGCGGRGRRSPSCSRRCCPQTGYVEALEAERTIEAQGRIENLEQLVEVGREFDAARPPSRRRTRSTCSCRRSRSSPTPTTRSDDEGLVTLMTLHNAKGLEYPTVFIAGCEDGVLPALARDRRGRAGGGAPAVLRRRHARHAQPVPDLRAPTRACSAPRATGCAAASSMRSPRSCSTSRSERVRSGAGPRGARHVAAAGSRRGERRGARRARPRADWAGERSAGDAIRGVAFRLGEDIVHAAFGEGVVTGVEPGGRDRRALRRRRLRAQADGRVRAGQPGAESTRSDVARGIASAP